MKKLGKLTNRIRKARRGKGKFCYCCCCGTPKDEKRFVNRARRRLSKILCKS